MVVWEASKFVPLHWCTKQPVYVANKIKTNYTGYFWSHTSGRTNVNHFTSTHMDSYPITLLSLEMIQKLLNELKDKHKQEVWHCSLILWSITERPGRYCTNSWTPNPRTRGAWPPPWLSHPTKCLARVAQTHGRLALWGGSRSSCASLPLSSPLHCQSVERSKKSSLESRYRRGDQTALVGRHRRGAEEDAHTCWENRGHRRGLGPGAGPVRGREEEQLQGCLERAKHPIHAQVSPWMHNKQLFRSWTEQLHNLKVSNILGTDLN